MDQINLASVTLLELPSELLQLIASLLDNSSQLQLGLTCKLLNYISLDTFLKKQNNIRLRFNSFSGYQVPHEALWALRAALWLKPFTSIVYNVTEGADTLLAQLFELYHLSKWLPKVEYLSLSFPMSMSWVHWLPQASTVRLDVRQWFIAITMLLQVAIEKGCKQISVRGGEEIRSFYIAETSLQTLEKKRCYIPETQGTPTQEQSHNAWRAANSTALSRSMQSAKQESVMYLERTSLSTFGIYSDMLLQPLFFPWTSALLSSSRITKLEITSWCTPRVTWSTLLCSVTMVKLEVLNLDCLSDSVEFIPSFVDLENFFTRHPRIHTLRLKSKSKQPPASTFTEAILPNLSSLSGHSIYIRSFLQMQQSHPDTLLHLKSVELMHCPSFFGSTFNYDIFDTALAQLAGFSGNNITLTLHFTHPASAWFENHVDLGPSKSVLCHLTCVSHLVISSGFTQAMCARATLLDWLGLFPSVETVAFVGLSGGRGNIAERQGVFGSGYSKMSENQENSSWAFFQILHHIFRCRNYCRAIISYKHICWLLVAPQHFLSVGLRK